MERPSENRVSTVTRLITVLLILLAASRAKSAEFSIKNTGRTLIYESADRQEFVGDLVFLSESRVVAGGYDGPSQSLQVFDLKTDRMIQKIPHDLTGIRDLDVSPDGQRLVAAGVLGQVQVWQTKDWSVLSGHSLHMARCVKFVQDSSLVASGGDIPGGNDLVVWNVDRQEMHRRWPAPDCYFRSLATSPDGKLFASVNDNSELCLWNIKDFKLVSTSRGDEIWPTHCLYFFKDSARIASGSSDPCVTIWNVRNCERLATTNGWKGFPTAVYGLRGDKFLLTVCHIGELRIYEVASGREVFQLESPNQFDCAALSPDGRTLLTTNCTEITVWNIDIPEKAKVPVQ